MSARAKSPPPRERSELAGATESRYGSTDRPERQRVVETAAHARRISIWCADWPVTTVRVEAGLPVDAPIAVVTANRVIACSQSARAQGVKRGLRRREAQGHCPDLVVLPRDEAAEARVFEPVVAALEAIAPGVEITRPGLAAIGVRGPTRYFGGETGVLHALSRGVLGLPALNGADLLIGIADGAFAAEQAARRGLIVDPGGSPAFLNDLPVETLDPSGASPLIDLLRRLGIRTLGAFAELPPRDVLARFGPDGAWAHRQAGGRDERPVSGRRAPVEFAVTLDLEPPVDRVDTVAFSARGVAEQFVGDLAAHGLACTCVELQALSENGEETVRRWRHAGVLSTVDVLDRVRWQLEGWLSGPNRPTGGVARVRLVPIEVVPTGTHQQALWGGSGAEDERAARALARVQTLLGHGSVLTPVLDGGRDPGQRTRLVPWGDEPTALRSPEQPWPGRLPAPAPSVLLDPPRPAQVLDAARRPVVVTERGALPAPPAFFGMGTEVAAVASWAGPWPVDERWWSPESARRVVRCQIVDVRGRAYLVTGTMPLDQPPRWQVDAIYD
jgi:protein ImuB